MSEEMVNHPKHYNEHPSGIECIEIVRHMTFNLGNAVKYIWRAGLKTGQDATQDLEKAAWYLQDEIKTRKLTDACERFHPGETCKPGDNHPSQRQEDIIK